MKFSELIKLSRPRFWLYTAGTFAVGASFGASSPADFLRVDYWLWFLYWLIPANIFLYGVNDLSDRDTDKFNDKKGDKELRYSSSRHSRLKFWVLVCLMVGAGLLLLLPLTSAVYTLLFFALGWAYSARPLRLKARPILDSASNVLYAMPGFAGYALISGFQPALFAILALWAWTWSMHLFSAIPDIDSDSKASLSTTAVVLGRSNSLLVCLTLWLAAASFAYLAGVPGWFTVLAASWYVGVCLILFVKTHLSVLKAYWYFPFVNGIVGACLFWIPWF